MDKSISTIIQILGKDRTIIYTPSTISHGKFLVYTGLETPQDPSKEDFLEILGIVGGEGHLLKGEPICIITSTNVERAYYYFNLLRQYVE